MVTEDASARSDTISAIAISVIRDNLERLTNEVKVLGTPVGKVVITGKFNGEEPNTNVTLRYLVEGKFIKGPNPEAFGAKTIADAAVYNIEEDLYASNFERLTAGKRYVTYSQE